MKAIYCLCRSMLPHSSEDAMKNEIAVVVLSQILADLRLSVLTDLLCGAAVASESRAEQSRTE